MFAGIAPDLAAGSFEDCIWRCQNHFIGGITDEIGDNGVDRTAYFFQGLLVFLPCFSQDDQTFCAALC